MHPAAAPGEGEGMTTETSPRTTGWHWSQWVAGVLAARFTTAFGLVAAAMVFADNAGGCQAIASPESYRTGRLMLVGLAVVLVGIWAVPAIVWRHHAGRFVALGLPAVALPLMAVVAMLGQPRSDWTLCLFQF